MISYMILHYNYIPHAYCCTLSLNVLFNEKLKNDKHAFGYRKLATRCIRPCSPVYIFYTVKTGKKGICIQNAQQ